MKHPFASTLTSAALALCLITQNVQAFSISHFLHGPLDCARNTVAFLRVNGVRVPSTASSKFFLQYHRIPKAQARLGDVRFNYRRNGGGHSQPVLGWRNGRLRCLNPSYRKHGWQHKTCPPGGIYLRPH